MDFLKTGMKYKNSSSKMQRLVAKSLLEIEKKRADRYEARLNKRLAAVPRTAEENALLFRSIREQIAQSAPGERDAKEQGARTDADHDSASG